MAKRFDHAQEDGEVQLWGGWPLQPLPLLSPLQDAGLVLAQHRVYLTLSTVRPLPGADAVPPLGGDISRRPPGAFKHKKALTTRDGHVLLLEYMEEVRGAGVDSPGARV